MTKASQESLVLTATAPTPKVDDAVAEELKTIELLYSISVDTPAELDQANLVEKEPLPLLDLQTKSRNWGNVLFRGASTTAATTILATLAAVTIFLVVQAWPALSDPDFAIRVFGKPESVSFVQFLLPQVFGTLLGAVVAMLIAVPVSLGVALFITHYAPRKLAAFLGYLVDLLAAIPSVVYGLWGGLWLLPKLQPVMQWLSDNFGWFPLFAGPVSPIGRVLFATSVILAVMIMPIITGVSREVFLRTPRLNEEAALALGATRWEMIKMTVLPTGKSGVISASMLGLGRALGETMAVAMILSPGFGFSWGIFQASQHSTIASTIALQYPEASKMDASALVAAGLVLFLITLVVNTLARMIVKHQDKKNGVTE